MPRDKTDTHKRVLTCIKKEFLEHGYEKASLQSIAKNVGITAAGLYRHFPSKQAMFSAMVEPIVSEFFKMCQCSMEETYLKLEDEYFLYHFNSFRAEKNRELLEYMYDNFDVFKLLLVCSEGTKYETFEDELVNYESQGIKDIFKILEKRGLPYNEISDDELHILATTFIAAFCETIKHEYSREKALKHLDFIGKMLYPGMKEVLGF